MIFNDATVNMLPNTSQNSMHNRDYSRDKLLPETASPADLVVCTLKEALFFGLTLKSLFDSFLISFESD